MKYLSLLLTLFIGLSCSHRTATNSHNLTRSPQSVALPVVQILSKNSANLEVNAGESIKVKFAIYDSLGTPVAGKQVNFYFSGNSGHFQSNQMTSNYNGEVENTFIAGTSDLDENKRITFEVFVERSFIGRLTSSQFLTIKSDPKLLVIKNFNNVSLVTSSFEWVATKNLIADEKIEYSLAFVPRDQAGSVIKSDGKFLVSFISEGNPILAVYYSDQTYRYKFQGPAIFGKKTFKVQVKNNYQETTHFIPEFVADFKPVFNLEKINLVKTEIDKNLYSISFSLLDIHQTAISTDYLPQVHVTDETGTKIPLESSEGIFSIQGEFPYGKGKKVLDLFINNEKSKAILVFPYNNLELAWDKVEFKLDKTYLHPFFVRPAVYDIFQEMESTGFTIKLNDIKGNPLTELTDLNLSLETKVGKGIFSPLKMITPGEFRGVFSPENNEQGKIVFLLKNEKKEIELLPNLLVGFVPKNNHMGKLSDWVSSAYSDELTIQLQENDKGEAIMVGFSFENEGINSIVPKGAACDTDPQDHLQASRSYSFDFDSQARQGIRLYVRDNTSSWDSKNRHASFYFFPRKVIPSFKKISKSELEVTLPTGESFLVNRKNGEFISKNILQDLPIDMGTGFPTCPASKIMIKKFPELNYMGKGIVLKVNNPTGSSMPEQPSREVTAQVYYYDSVSGKQVQCLKLLKTDFFTNGVLKFASDEEVAQFLKIKCGEAFSNRLKTLITP